MTSALELLDRIAAIGGSVRPAGDRLILRAGASPVPANLVRDIQQSKSDILAVLAASTTGESTWWRDQFNERAAHRQFDAGYARSDAEQLAYGGVVLDWHRRHGAHPDPNQCAGCGEELS